MLKVCHVQTQGLTTCACTDAEEYNRQIGAEEKARIDAGKSRRGKKKKYKDIPVWDPTAEMKDIVSRMIYGKHK